VPEEPCRLISLVSHQYFPTTQLLDFNADSRHALSRAQIEVVASKVSDRNQCFYWTTWHTYLLRESGKAAKIDYILAGAIDPSIDSGVEHGCELVTFASSVAGSDRAALDTARRVLRERIGAPVVVTASLIAANFSMLDRVANAIGISADAMIIKPSAEFRAQLGIKNYPAAANTLR
jgi:AhpD family alkylhydroperoxidase